MRSIRGKAGGGGCTLVLQLPVGLQLPLAFVCVYLTWLGCEIATLRVCLRVSMHANAGDNCAANIA